MSVRKTTNLTVGNKERERRVREIEEEGVFDYYHKFTPVQLVTSTFHLYVVLKRYGSLRLVRIIRTEGR